MNVPNLAISCRKGQASKSAPILGSKFLPNMVNFSMMKEVSPGIVWYTLLINVLIALVLGACVKPVDIESFLSDDKIQDIIIGGTTGGGGGVIVDIDPPGIEDLKPVLMIGVTQVIEGYEVSLSSSGSVTITVGNVGDYDSGNIAWYSSSGAVLPMMGALTITAGTHPFDVAMTYIVTVVGEKGGVPYSTYFYVIIED